MKTLRKLSALLFAVVLGTLALAAPATAFADVTYDEDVAAELQSPSYVVDQSELLTDDEVSQLNSMGREVLTNYKTGVYYVTVDSLEDCSDAQDYTEDFIDTYDLESLSPKGCVVCLICVPEGEFAIVSAGDASKTIPSSVLEHLINEVNPYLGRSDWFGGGYTFFDDVSQTLSGKTANATSNVKYNGTYVTDAYGLLSSDKRAELEAQATALAEQYNMGVYLLIVDYMQDSNGNKLTDPTSSQRTNFATSFYRANNLGLGSGNDGIMLAVAVDSRDYVTIGYGQGSYTFSNEGISYMEGQVTDRLGDNDWYGGFKAYYDSIGEQLEYYSVKGDTWTEPDLLSLILKVLAALGIPALFASSEIKREKSAMKTAREQREADNYLVPGSFVLTHAQDTFINTTMTVTPIPKHESSGGGGGGFGGGGWGGGGGGGFSSSGGGKF